MYIHTYVYKYTCTYAPMYVCTYVHTYVPLSGTPQALQRMYIHTYIHSRGSLHQLTSSRKSPSFRPAASALESASTLATYCSPGTCTVGRNVFLARAEAEGRGGEHTKSHVAHTYVCTYVHAIHSKLRMRFQVSTKGKVIPRIHLHRQQQQLYPIFSTAHTGGAASSPTHDIPHTYTHTHDIQTTYTHTYTYTQHITYICISYDT